MQLAAITADLVASLLDRSATPVLPHQRHARLHQQFGRFQLTLKSELIAGLLVGMMKPPLPRLPLIFVPQPHPYFMATSSIESRPPLPPPTRFAWLTPDQTRKTILLGLDLDTNKSCVLAGPGGYVKEGIVEGIITGNTNIPSGAVPTGFDRVLLIPEPFL